MTLRVLSILLASAACLAGRVDPSPQRLPAQQEARSDAVFPAPLRPGRYCLREEMLGETGTGRDIPLGPFLMAVSVTRSTEGYSVAFWNLMPDSQEMLQAESDQTEIMADGSLSFTFTDGWGNEGHARIGPDRRIDLVQTKIAPENQIGRNYGSFTVSADECSASEFN